jgi:hypothetical protein
LYERTKSFSHTPPIVAADGTLARYAGVDEPGGKSPECPCANSDNITGILPDDVTEAHRFANVVAYVVTHGLPQANHQPHG